MIIGHFHESTFAHVAPCGLPPRNARKQTLLKGSGNREITAGNSFHETDIIGYQHSVDKTDQVPTRKRINFNKYQSIYFHSHNQLLHIIIMQYNTIQYNTLFFTFPLRLY